MRLGRRRGRRPDGGRPRKRARTRGGGNDRTGCGTPRDRRVVRRGPGPDHQQLHVQWTPAAFPYSRSRSAELYHSNRRYLGRPGTVIMQRHVAEVRTPEPVAGFLSRVRTLVYRHEARRAVFLAIALLGALALALPLFGHWVGIHRTAAMSVLGIGALLAVLILIGAIVF